ncbi:retinol dehydrogenase 12 [Phycomyces blakesleeanus]|uniref:Uncharacterized protein n=2 Tax=Phycomyces blakesleeanus TaxID=4837 RepID=A0A163ANP9_PHYB8|nr:hypothetical protein PHYBLDRAFT_167080 [Phycomyces blakesleeanus NRRL 1555(-)]OAD74731.1 hypothetical protein PHYBLDRAFT_167080 [Phycomyces blakesleeanus NRRL 1555(-)]|eukprot:XP_018292771.1 hypothetical protein PHYBLDRAFT_167080 [Phycomyces blakesleeanus NRRL 1555(-)]
MDKTIIPIAYSADQTYTGAGEPPFYQPLLRLFNKEWNYSKTNLIGKVAIVTGANDGIGKESAIDLAKRNATVIIACRDSEKSRQALEDIRLASGSDKVTLEYVDFASLQSVKDFYTAFIATHKNLHLLINNAGVFNTTRKETVDGFEGTFGVNHVGPFLLTELLLPTLIASKPSRIINVGSAGMRWATINFDDIQLEKNFSGFGSYGQSKLANALYAYHLSRRLSGKGVTANVLHPGAVRTSIAARDKKLLNTITTTIFGLFALYTKSPIQGAQTILYLATAPEVEEKSGLYWENCAVHSPINKLENDEDTQNRLYEISNLLVKKYI